MEKLLPTEIALERLSYLALPYTSRRSGEDEVAHLERMLLAHIGDNAIDAVDHIERGSTLASLAIDV